MVRGGSTPTSPAVVSIDPYAPFADLFLLAAMTWPASERERGSALALWAADMQARIEAEGEQRAADEVTTALRAAAEKHGCTVDDILAQPGAREAFSRVPQDWTDHARAIVRDAVFLPAGSWRAVADGPGLQTVTDQLRRTARHEGRIVGQALCLTASMAQLHPEIPASLNRTWFVMQADTGSSRLALSSDRSSLVKIWGEWCAIAPLQAAVRLWLAGAKFAPDPQAEAAGLFEPQGIGTVLGWAKWFRTWAVGFHPPRSRVPLISDSTAAIYETIVPELKPPLWPLTEVQLAAARAYKAATNKHD